MTSMQIRQRLVRKLRATNTLQAAERVRYAQGIATTYLSNRQFKKAHLDEAFPPLWVIYDAFGMTDLERYWNTGQIRANYIAEMAEQFMSRKPGVVCDWGCGPARVVRHLAAKHVGLFAKVIGTDYNVISITWDTENIDAVSFYTNQLAPPLPLEPESVDFIFSYSVFTHLTEESGTAWIQEQNRVTVPGGLIMLTTHGDRYRPKMLQDERDEYDVRGIVIRGSVKEGSRIFTTFTSPDYVRDVLGRDLKVLLHDDTGNMAAGQDVWLLRSQ